MWIVMTSAAQMPSSCWGRYRNVALVKLTPEYASSGLRPKMISDRAKGIEKLEHFGHHSVGLTEACAYRRALRRAEERAAWLNQGLDEEQHLPVDQVPEGEGWRIVSGNTHMNHWRRGRYGALCPISPAKPTGQN